MLRFGLHSSEVPAVTPADEHISVTLVNLSWVWPLEEFGVSSGEVGLVWVNKPLGLLQTVFPSA